MRKVSLLFGCHDVITKRSLFWKTHLRASFIFQGPLSSLEFSSVCALKGCSFHLSCWQFLHCHILGWPWHVILPVLQHHLLWRHEIQPLLQKLLFSFPLFVLQTFSGLGETDEHNTDASRAWMANGVGKQRNGWWTQPFSKSINEYLSGKRTSASQLQTGNCGDPGTRHPNMTLLWLYLNWPVTLHSLSLQDILYQPISSSKTLAAIQAWWLGPIIPANQEAKVEGSQVWGQPREVSEWDPVSK